REPVQVAAHVLGADVDLGREEPTSDLRVERPAGYAGAEPPLDLGVSRLHAEEARDRGGVQVLMVDAQGRVGPGTCRVIVVVAGFNGHEPGSHDLEVSPRSPWRCGRRTAASGRVALQRLQPGSGR